MLDQASVQRWIDTWEDVKRKYPGHVCHPIIVSAAIVGAYVRDVGGLNLFTLLPDPDHNSSRATRVNRILTQFATSAPPDQVIAFPSDLDLTPLLKTGWQRLEPGHHLRSLPGPLALRLT